MTVAFKQFAFSPFSLFAYQILIWRLMGIMTIDKAINNAIASLKMEGYDIDDESIQHCKELLENKLTWEQYMDIVKGKIKLRATDK